MHEIDSRNLSYFREEENRIYRWEHDVIDGIERELDTIKRTIRETERLARNATNVQERLELENQAENLRRKKRRMRSELEDREDEISAKRRTLLENLEQKMIQSTNTDDIFIISWATK